MAIKMMSEDKKLGTRIVEINNGDLMALQKIKKDWDFKDIESALRYAVAVLSITKDRKLFYETESGEKRVIEPADSLKKGGLDDDGTK